MKVLWVIMIISVPIILSVVLLGCAGKRPASIGVIDGRLSPCPKSPNCVSSMAKDEKHYIEPLAYSSERQQAFKALEHVLEQRRRARIVQKADNYLHVEFKSRFFRFVDDVEFYFPKGEPLVHVRSASRLGKSDLGVNRKRMNSVRKAFSQALANPDIGVNP